MNPIDRVSSGYFSRTMIVATALAAAALAIAFIFSGCGKTERVRTAANTGSAECQDARQWQRNGGTGALAEMQHGISQIRADLSAGDSLQLQVDGTAMMQITGMDVVSNAPPFMVNSWVKMVLDLNRAGSALTGGDYTTAGGLTAQADAFATVISSALRQRCGI